MNSQAKLEEFAGRFVIATFQERFIHEALKKPDKLHSRICHSILEVFPTRYKGGEAPFKKGDIVFPICGTGSDLIGGCNWEDLSSLVRQGTGLLIASLDLTEFYAETESEYGSPYQTFSYHK